MASGHAAEWRGRARELRQAKAAEKAAKTAQTTLEREDVYVTFEPPYFKVHVGDFATKEEADKFVQAARKRGYDTPFPVQTELRESGR